MTSSASSESGVTSRKLIAAALAGALVSAAATSVVVQWSGRRHGRRGKKGKQNRQDDVGSDVEGAERQSQDRRTSIVRGVPGLIGSTPLMRIESLSDMTGCEILGKAEFLNPAGSPKDRVALQILLDAESDSFINPHRGDCVFEGTVGSTGISLATLCSAKGYRCSIVLPDDVAEEKAQLLAKLGAEIKKVRPRGIVDPRHFVNEARAQASAFGRTDSPTAEISNGTDEAGAQRPRGFFADQFETPSNFLAHYKGTGQEIWRQCGGRLGSDEDDEDVEHDRPARLDAFVAGAGTGGTLSGVAAALHEKRNHLQVRRSRAFQTNGSASNEDTSWPPAVRIVAADPFGSGLFHKVHHGVMYSSTEAEGTRRRHQVDSIVEGIGMNRITHNLSLGVDLVDDAVRVTDEEAVRMSRWLSVRDGLFVGSSSSVNVVAAVKTAMRLKREWAEKRVSGDDKRPTVVTILCDSGVRHLSKFHNDEVLKRDYGIEVPQDAMDVDISDMLR